MRIFLKLVTSYSVLSLVGNRLILHGSATSASTKYFIPNFLLKIFKYKASNMSQRSITSFFAKTPKKSIEKDLSQGNKSKSVEKQPSEQADNDIPESNGNGLEKTSKRQRIDSSSSESKSPIKPSPVKNELKTSKRQRIDSSSSESKSPIKPSTVKKEMQKKIKRQRIDSSSSEEASTSPKREASEEGTITQADKPQKTYASPRSKKIKIEKSPLVEKNVKVDSEKSNTPKKAGNKIKNDKATVETKKTLKKSPSDKKSKEIKEKDVEVKHEVDEKKQRKNPFEKQDKVVVKTEAKEKDLETVKEEDYNPAKSKYHPIKDACWTKGQEVPYLALAKTFEIIEATSARLKIVEILSNYFRSVIVLTPEDLLPSVYMCLNQLAPAYHSLELGIAETYLMKAIGQCTGRTLAQMKAASQRTGDLGLVAEQARSKQRTMFTPPPLKGRRVFATLKELAGMTGQASVNKKIGKIQSLYVACKNSEARYLIRSLAGKLRIGLAEQSVLQALAVACTMTPPGTDVLDASKGVNPDEFKSKVEATSLIIKTTYCECPNYDLLIPVLLEHGVESLPRYCRLTPGIPLKPMLAHPTKGVHEVFNRFEGVEFTCEYKYDGERAQLHVPSPRAITSASLFSRNQENNTSKYPDVLGRLPGLLKDGVDSCVLDCEAVAYDVVNKQILPFQILSTRKRKDANESEIKVQVCLFVFDLLYLNGEPLVKEPLMKRRQLLREHFNEVPGEWQFATWSDCAGMEEVQQFLEEAVRGSCEGLMVKTLTGSHATYEIAKRSHNWLKLKKDYLDGVGDTIDAVVIGGYSGRGKRAGHYGGFLLACYDPVTEEYQSLCKIGTGFSDEDLQNMSEALKEHLIDDAKGYYRYDQSHAPDAWFSPALVWEVRCADLSLSPSHRAALGLVEPDKGVSLRFPRFIRSRDDKTAENATSAQQIAELYLAQDQVKNQTTKTTVDDDFY